MRILIAAHSHPQLSRGGAEISAHRLFSAIAERSDCQAWFLGCTRDQTNQRLGASISQPFGEREYVYAAGAFDWFKFSNGDARFPREFRALLQKLEPEIVHFHHFLNFGVEAFHHVRRTLPDCRIVLSLHEYLAICHHYGQMITKPDGTLCYEANLVGCSRCFKDISPGNFFLRKLYIKQFFDLVDQFIAPSAFLADRYVAWGIAPEQVVVLENVIAAPARNVGAARESIGAVDLLRVGFFGQISSLKGINVLFDAAQILEERKIYNVVFEIYGDHSGQPSELQAEFLSRLKQVGRNVKCHGPYDQHRVDKLMQSVDLVLVPSIWWENSPVVIQEAFRNRRPVICSDIGGMAEKVRDGIDGLHFPVGNAVALASLLTKLAASPELLTGLADSIRVPATVAQTTDRYLELYASLRRSGADAGADVVHHD